MNYLKVRASFQSALSDPTHTFNEQNIIQSVLLLTTLLIAIVPVIAAPTTISPLILVAITGLFYGTILLLTDTIFEGLCGAALVLYTFFANIQLPEQSVEDTTIQFNLMLVDFAVIPLPVLLLWWNNRSRHESIRLSIPHYSVSSHDQYSQRSSAMARRGLRQQFQAT